MSITAFGLREGGPKAAAIMHEALYRERVRLEQIYDLTGDELALVSLMLQHRPKRQIAKLMEKTLQEVEAIRGNLMRRLGVRNVRDLVDLARMTGLAWDPTPAQYLSRYVLPQLEGGDDHRVGPQGSRLVRAHHPARQWGAGDGLDRP